MAGVDDDEWGAVVVCAYTGEAAEAELAAAAREALGPAAVPKRFLRVAELPRLSNGKPDRQAVAGLFA
ncbi:hypothetical protein GCM10027591_18340 [Zhihengliuella somnathii]